MTPDAAPDTTPDADPDTTPDTARDADSVSAAGHPRREVAADGFRENHFQAVFRQSVLDDIHLHGQSRTDIEVCGVLLGKVHRDDHGPYLLVEHNVRGDSAKEQSTNVTFTAATWAHIQGIMDRDFADEKMVGWYHTHPGFGIFLSDMDVFICDNFFNLPWQVAFVYDPRSGEEGNFVWRKSRPTREAVLIEDDVTPAAAAVPLISVADATDPDRAGVVDDKLIELMIRVRRLERRQRAILVALVFAVAFIAMWAVEFSAVPVPPAKPATAPVALPAPPPQTRPK